MQMKRCENGHFYDPKLSISCPYCGVSVSEPPRTDRLRGGGATNPGGEPLTVPRAGVSTPAAAAPAASAPAPAAPAPAPAAHSSAPGVTVAYWGKKNFDPVVGWLVCVEGPEKGRDYRIRSGNNRIGRDEIMEIVIREDDAISRVKQALITFDDRSSRFVVKEGDGRSLTYLNDEPVDSSALLTPWDMLEMGKSKFCFVPLCGEAFRWEITEEETE